MGLFQKKEWSLDPQTTMEKEHMPSNYTKEIRAGVYKLLSPFQLELTSYFLSQGIKRNCTQAN
jgi:hypothetical protein